MDDLEKTISDLITRKNALPIDSAERAFYERQLRAIRYSHEGAGEIIEGLDADHWGCYCRPLPAVALPQGKVIPVRQPSRKSESPS